MQWITLQQKQAFSDTDTSRRLVLSFLEIKKVSVEKVFFYPDSAILHNKHNSAAG